MAITGYNNMASNFINNKINKKKIKIYNKWKYCNIFQIIVTFNNESHFHCF